jgi:hypothetical protein
MGRTCSTNGGDYITYPNAGLSLDYELPVAVRWLEYQAARRLEL